MISGEALQRSARLSSISLKIGIMRVFSKKQTSIFYLGQKASHKKNYRVTNFSIFHDFSTILSLITQRVFIAKTCARVLWKGILLSKIYQINKPTTTIFFKYFFGFDELKWKIQFFIKSKKIFKNLSKFSRGPSLKINLKKVII
jgi:spore maturation protein CgeB